MDHEFLSIVEKLAILEGRIAPKDNVIAETATKQKKPALFANLKKDESAIPMVGGVEFAEEKSTDVLSQVKASLADYLKNAEENIKQDKDLIAKKKQDLDLKKKELRDLELQTRAQEEPVEEAIPDTLEETHEPVAIGDKVVVTAPNEYEGMQGEVFDLGQRGAFIIVDIEGDLCSMHSSDVEVLHKDVDWDQDEEELDEEPNQTPAGGEGVANDTDPTYAQGGNSTYAEGIESAPVKTMNIPLDENGGCVLVEIHGDERQGFSIKRAGKEMSTKFASLEEAEMALEMFNARRAQMAAAEQSADYIEEK